MLHYIAYGAISTWLVALNAAAGAANAGSADAPAAMMADGYRHKAAGRLPEAAASFRAAGQAGADPQRIALELGYVQASLGVLALARTEFDFAAAGPDAALSARARRELAVLPHRWWADVYADSYGWQRLAGGNASTDLVPTVRARAFLRLSFSLDLNLYLFAQGTRDVASRGRDGAGLPEIYADDYALAGGGVLLRLWARRLGLFAQAGPAFDLLDDERERMTPDVRGGGFLVLESSRCRPALRHGLSGGWWPCADLYAEGVYVNRFAHNVIGYGRARAGFGYLMTGPVLWQAMAEARGSADRNADFYNNFADAGLGHRWRLLGPVPLDLIGGVHAGRYLGRQGRDPLPAEPRYLDLRLLAATYLEF